jgi:sugar phosphate isomerase/epimerase
MDAVRSDRLKMILDPANLFHAGEAHPENARRTLDEAFAAFGGDIVAAHGKDIREGDGIAFCGTGRGIVDFPYMAKKLREAGFAGDMFLHGIYDPDDMPRALAHWTAALAEAV